MKLMHLECFIPVNNIHDVMLFLEEKKAYNVKVSAFKNGGQEQPKGNNKTMGAVDWLVNHIKKDVTVGDIKEAFQEAGFSTGGIYSSLTTAVKNKRLKKTAAGKYKPVA